MLQLATPNSPKIFLNHIVTFRSTCGPDIFIWHFDMSLWGYFKKWENIYFIICKTLEFQLWTSTSKHEPFRLKTHLKIPLLSRGFKLSNSQAGCRVSALHLFLRYTNTVKWSDFDRRYPKMGVFLQSTEATPCGHLKWKRTPENPPVDTMYMAAMAIVIPWKIVEDFQSFVKNAKLWPSVWKFVSCKNIGLKISNCSRLKACFKGYTFCLTTFLARPSTGAQQSHERAPKCSNDLERSKFRQQVQSFVCVHPWRRVTFKFLEMLKNASEVTLVPKNIFS